MIRIPAHPSSTGSLGAVLALAVIVTAASTTAQELDTPNTGQAERPEWDFTFGSYGRVVGASDLRGGRGKELDVVAYGPRLEEAPYLELDLGTTYAPVGGPEFATTITLALTDALFHYDGDFDGALVIRNAYVDASSFGVEGLSVWAGSQMYRGDDIYLLDFWPLDDLNTVGGGARYAVGDLVVSAHGGVNQLDNLFQYQEIEVAGPTFETEQLILMDRVRALGSLKLEQLFFDVTEHLSMKLALYGEYQSLGSGEFEDENDVRWQLPADRGFTAGAQLGFWGFGDGAFANLFFRYSGGLAAYDELAIPRGLAQDRTAADARLVRLAASLGYETRWVGATAGAYVDWFGDADDDTYDRDDYAEGAVALRPVLFITDHFHQAFEVSYQRRIPRGLSARTDTYLEPAILKLGVLPLLSVGRGVFARPQIRLIYNASFLNDGARDLYPEGDSRRAGVQHFLGVGAEWWFNSSTYDN